MTATSTGPDLSVAVDAVEALMDDECTITRGRADSARILNRTTGQMTTPTSELVYGPGRCKIKQVFQHNQAIEGGRVVTITRYEVGIPMTDGTPDHEPAEGDVVVVLDSRRDPGLIGRELRVTDPVYGTFQIQRKFQAEMRGTVQDRP